MWPIRIEFQVTAEDYQEASVALSGNTWGWYKPLGRASLAAGAVGIALLLGADRRSWLAPVLLMLFALYTGLYPLLRKRSPSGQIAKAVGAAGTIGWEISDERLSFRTDFSHGSYSWYAFDRLVETRNLFLLVRKFGGINYVPKRAFADAGQIEAFRGLAQERLAPPTGAFPVRPLGDGDARKSG